MIIKKKWKYWALNPKKELNLGSDKEYSEKFLEIFSEAVKCRLRSHSPMGSMLSGGMDSSSIVCTAKHVLGNKSQEPFYTFSNIFDKVSESDERYYINHVLSKYDLQPQFILGDDISPLHDMEKVMWHVEGPTLAPNLFLTWSIYSQAQKKLKVILSGYDGDTTLHRHGPGFFVEYALKLHWIRLLKEVNAVSKVYDMPQSQLFWRSLIIPLISPPLTKIRDFFNRKSYWEQESIINQDFAHKTNAYGRKKALNEKLSNLKSSKAHHYYNLSSGLLQEALEELDKLSAAFSIETRYPFFDKRLIEFSLALPPEQKLFDGWDRIILRRAMVNILPEKVQWRKEKSDLSPIFSRNMTLFEKNRINRMISVDSNLIREYIDINKIPKISDSLDEETIIDNPFLWQTTNMIYWVKNKKIGILD